MKWIKKSLYLLIIVFTISSCGSEATSSSETTTEDGDQTDITGQIVLPSS